MELNFFAPYLPNYVRTRYEIQTEIHEQTHLRTHIHLSSLCYKCVNRKERRDLKNSKVKKWEELMNNFQKLIPNTPKGEKWRLMDKIFSVNPIE